MSKGEKNGRVFGKVLEVVAPQEIKIVANEKIQPTSENKQNMNASTKLRSTLNIPFQGTSITLSQDYQTSTEEA